VRMNRRTWTVALSYGVILGLMNLCFYLALARIPLGIAVTIEFLGPLAVALAGSRRWLDAFWAVLAAGGMVLLMEGRGDLNLVGFLFALAAGTCWGLYIMVGAALGRHTTEGNGLALGMAVAALKEQLALRLVYTRIKSESDQRVTRQRGIALPKLPEPAPGETGPYCVIAKHRAKPGKADAYERRMLADLDKTRAEPGALQFHIHRDRSDPDLFVIYEVWRDLRTLREHYEKPYVKQFVVDSAEYIEGDMEAQWIVMASQYVAGRPRETQK
jgi:quinol monooxygenase YgiN